MFAACRYSTSTYRDDGLCPNCLGFFLMDNLWYIKFASPSKKAKDEDKTSLKRDKRGEGCTLLSSWRHGNTSTDFQKCILATFKNDKISEACYEDKIIVTLGSMMFEKYTVHQYDSVRQSMRQLGRLLLEIKSIKPNLNSLFDVIKPEHFDLIIYAVQRLCVSSKK